MKRKTKNDQGLTLIELIVTLAMALIVLSIGIPAFQSLSQTNFRTTKVNDLVSSLHRARSKAIFGNTSVSIRRSENGWNAGWSIFEDGNANGAIDAGDELLRAVDRGSPLFTISSTEFVDSITFDSAGNSAGAGTFLYCGNENPNALRSQRARAIIINGIGHARLSRDDNGNGIHEDRLGTDLSCN
ncbi:MAG: prepilin-type N-terminal cleavage/methylation domain-containing protein [Gammaproteobacteria bacterium]|nr:prepilin-type N-terminal cleavage/methylation domain-containing protein [Gammaproteobacteria bacterium]